MKKDQLIAISRAHTLEIASKIAKNTKKGDIIALIGPMGSGKTTFTKGLLGALGIAEMRVKSPTFTYIREYMSDDGLIIHADLYRLEGKELAALEFITEAQKRNPRLIVIEWADYLKKHLPDSVCKITITPIDETKRHIKILK